MENDSGRDLAARHGTILEFRYACGLAWSERIACRELRGPTKICFVNMLDQDWTEIAEC